MLRDILTKDFGWKLFSLLLAGFIWVTVHKLIEEPEAASPFSGSTRETYPELPVIVEAAAADMHLYHVQPDSVAVTVSGPSDVMSVLQDHPVRVTVDLSNFDPVKMTNQSVNVSVPGGITLVKVVPDRVRIILPPKQ